MPTMQHISFRCRNCGLEFESDVGPQSRREAERDGRRETAYYRAFWCPEEGKPLTVDVQEAAFDGGCPDCGAHLDLLADFPLDACPQCHAPTGVEKTPEYAFGA